MRELSNEEINTVAGGNADGCYQNFGTEDIYYHHGQTITSYGSGGLPMGAWECFNGVWFAHK